MSPKRKLGLDELWPSELGQWSIQTLRKESPLGSLHNRALSPRENSISSLFTRQHSRVDFKTSLYLIRLQTTSLPCNCIALTCSLCCERWKTATQQARFSKHLNSSSVALSPSAAAPPSLPASVRCGPPRSHQAVSAKRNKLASSLRSHQQLPLQKLNCGTRTLRQPNRLTSLHVFRDKRTPEIWRIQYRDDLVRWCPVWMVNPCAGFIVGASAKTSYLL
ncbi:hypothetical protein MHYP_G00241930 [Metynnis hypsauchen]